MAVRTALRRILDDISLPRAAKATKALDLRGLPPADAGCDAIIKASLNWLKLAQDYSATADGGFARDFSLLNGWAASYPETSGYIVPTFLDEADALNDVDLKQRARRCLDWLLSIQFPSGAFQGGKIGQEPRVPVTFNTGQILFGLAAGAARLDAGTYLEPMRRAATWLMQTQDPDGCWRKHPTPFGEPGEKVYETHVAWALFEADRVSPGEGFGAAGLKQVSWALTKQQKNGWLASNCLDNPEAPLTHTIGYALRGIVEAHRWSGDKALLDAACRTTDGLLPAIGPDGHLAGRLDSTWNGVVDWVCLTGSAQIAHSLFMLAKAAGRTDYAEKGASLNSNVRRAVALSGDPNIAGGVKGSFPVSGDYGRFQYLNWAAKFLVDSCRAELTYRETRSA